MCGNMPTRTPTVSPPMLTPPHVDVDVRQHAHLHTYSQPPHTISQHPPFSHHLWVVSPPTPSATTHLSATTYGLSASTHLSATTCGLSAGTHLSATTCGLSASTHLSATTCGLSASTHLSATTCGLSASSLSPAPPLPLTTRTTPSLMAASCTFRTHAPTARQRGWWLRSRTVYCGGWLVAEVTDRLLWWVAGG